jgi:hypothetical protein
MTKISQISPDNLFTNEYEENDIKLIPSFEVDTYFEANSYIEYYIFDLNKNLLLIDYEYNSYTIENDLQSSLNNQISKIQINPERDLTDKGFTQGSYFTYYNFLNNQIGTQNNLLYISEISTDRKEIRLDSNTLTPQQLTDLSNKFISSREETNFFSDFYINFGDNNLVVANNLKLDNDDPSSPTLLVKLYNELNPNFDIKSEGWVVTLLENPISYEIEFEDEIIEFNDKIKLRGPNFNLELKDQINNSTPLSSYEDLTSSPSSNLNTQIQTLLQDKNIEINIDYSDFNNFIHFSSAESRLLNFYNKVYLLEEYSSSISQIQSSIVGPSSSSSEVLGSIQQLKNKQENILNNFDKYEYFLFYDNNPYSWPKSNTPPPYNLLPTNDPITLSWFGSTNEDSPLYGGIILSASLYDAQNKDFLQYSIPEYLKDDPQNDQYRLFVDMLAQHYDNIWIYIKDVSNKFNSDNRLNFGISKDLVADTIRDLGIKIYQNNFSVNDLYSSFLGITENGGLFPFNNITGSLPTPQGYEYLDTLVSASNDIIPLDDVNKSLYKRIYHNLPYLLNSKGTIAGLRALITSYGIPDTILRINEFGGKSIIDNDKWDRWENEYNYTFKTEGDNFISSSFILNSNWGAFNGRPDTVAFRFKTNGIEDNNVLNYSLWNTDENVALTLRYTGSALLSGSHQGSIIDPYYQYAHLDFYPDTSNTSQTSSIYLPFYNGDWWSVMINKDGDDFTLLAGNKIYEGGDNSNLLGFYQTSSISSTSSLWVSSSISTFTNSNIIGGNTYNNFSGSLQEIRYYNLYNAPLIPPIPITPDFIVFITQEGRNFSLKKSNLDGNEELNNFPISTLAITTSIDKSGNIYIGGNSINNISIIKLNSNGNQILTADHGRPVNAITVDNDENIYVGGVRTLTDFKTTRKLDPNGNELWSADHEASVLSIALDKNNNVYTGGSTPFQQNITLRKYNINGGEIWNNYYGATIRGIATDVDNDIYIVGSPPSQTYANNNDGGIIYEIRKLDSNGNIIWSASHGGILFSIAVDINKNVYVGGVISGVDNKTTRKLDPNGNELWSVNHLATVLSIALDKNNNVYTGGLNASEIITTRKYTTDGVLIWSIEPSVLTQAISIYPPQQVHLLD